MVFDVEITDLYGNVLAPVPQYTDVWFQPEVSNDRSGNLILSVYNPAVPFLTFVNPDGKLVPALGRMVRIKYRDVTQLWGIIVKPEMSTESKQITMTIQGPAATKLRHRQLNYGDDIVGTDDTPVHSAADWTTMEKIVDAAKDTPGQYALNIPDIGVNVVNVSGVAAPPDVWTDIERGSNNWDKLTEVGDSAIGGEFDVVPHDPTEDELPFDTTMVEVIP